MESTPLPSISKNAIIKSAIEKVYHSGLKIVDIGCGTTPLFWDKSVNVDHNTPEMWIEKMIKQQKEGILTKEWAESEIERFKKFPNFVQAEAEKLPFEDAEFDYVILSEILEHADKPEEMLNEAQRVGKILVITVPNEFQWIAKNKPFTHPDHKNLFTEETLLYLIRKVELQILNFIKVNGFGWSHFIVFAVSKNAHIDKKG